MARRVFLHAGLPKTGTTFLQTMMWHNRARLREQGFLYPGSTRMDHYRAWQDVRFGPHKGAWSRLREEIDAWDGDALLSHEFFSMATKDQAAQVVEDLQPARVEVLFTLRAYELQLPAVWQEALKMGSQRSFGEFMDEMLSAERGAGTLRGGRAGRRSRGADERAWSWASQDIRTVLRRWSTAVPASQVTVIPVPAPGSPRTLLWERWCEAVGIDDSVLDHDVPFANESLGAPQAALLLRVVPHLSGPLTSGGVRHRWVRGYFGHEVLGPQRGPRFGPRPEQLAQLGDLSDRAVAAIGRRGYRVVGDLGDLRLDAPVATAHPDDVSDAEIVDVAARAIEQMIRDVRELTEELDALRSGGGRTDARLRRVLARAGRPARLVSRIARRARAVRRRRKDRERHR